MNKEQYISMIPRAASANDHPMCADVVSVTVDGTEKIHFYVKEYDVDAGTIVVLETMDPTNVRRIYGCETITGEVEVKFKHTTYLDCVGTIRYYVLTREGVSEVATMSNPPLTLERLAQELGKLQAKYPQSTFWQELTELGCKIAPTGSKDGGES